MDRVLVLFLVIILFSIMYIDINKKYIPNFLNALLLFLSIIIVRLENFSNFFIGASTYTLPIIIVYGYVSDILKKEIFGFGDIKLIIPLGGILYKESINLFLQIYIFYTLTFLLASVFIMILYIKNFKNRNILKNREIAFAPYLCISFFILYKYMDYIRYVYE